MKGQLQDLGVYWNWTRATLLENKAARYEGIASDVCITEILEGSNCEVSPKCYEMMLENRIDTGYLLSHRCKTIVGFFQINSTVSDCCTFKLPASKDAKTAPTKNTSKNTAP